MWNLDCLDILHLFFYNTCLQRAFNVVTLRKFYWCYNKCLKRFFGFPEYSSLTTALLETGLASRSTAMHIIIIHGVLKTRCWLVIFCCICCGVTLFLMIDVLLVFSVFVCVPCALLLSFVLLDTDHWSDANKWMHECKYLTCTDSHLHSCVRFATVAMNDICHT